jgi:hypothetical protein
MSRSAQKSHIFMCRYCGKTFYVAPSGKWKKGMWSGKTCCCSSHLHAWQKLSRSRGHFKPGHIPYNKGLKGIHYSSATEFKKGNIPASHKPIGTIVLRHHKNRNDHGQNFIKVAEPNKWMSYTRFVWEKDNGPVPKGMTLAHLNHDTHDDSPKNLKLMTKAENINYHRALLCSFRKPRKWEIPIELLWRINRGEISQKDAAEEIGCTPNVISFRLKKLAKLKNIEAYEKSNHIPLKRYSERQLA